MSAFFYFEAVVEDDFLGGLECEGASITYAGVRDIDNAAVFGGSRNWFFIKNDFIATTNIGAV